MLSLIDADRLTHEERKSRGFAMVWWTGRLEVLGKTRGTLLDRLVRGVLTSD